MTPGQLFGGVVWMDVHFDNALVIF